LKLKEISYIHAEAYASGELKHGPIALIDENVPVVVMAPNDALFDKTVSTCKKSWARKGKVILISDRAGLDAESEGTWGQIEMPPVADALAPILYCHPCPTAGLSYCHRQGDRCRPATQPSQIGDRRMT